MRALIAIGIIVGILVIIGLYLKTWYDKITFKPSLKGGDLSNLNLQTLLSMGETSFDLFLNLEVSNGNSFAIPCKNLKAWLYYDRTIIAETSADLASQKFLIPAHGSRNVTDKVNVHINSASIRLLKEAALKKSPKVDYTIQLNVFGVSLTYSDYFPFQA